MCEEELGGDIGILLQVRIAEGNESSHRGGEETSLESKSERAWLTGEETYKNEDAFCTSFPILHIFFVFKFLYTGDIHREDRCRRFTILSCPWSSGIVVCVLQRLLEGTKIHDGTVEDSVPHFNPAAE